MKTRLLVLLTVLSLVSSVCYGQWPYDHRDRGLALGALLGGLTGGAIGHNNHHTAEGALIGGAVGALAGAAIGDSVDTEIARDKVVYEQHVANQLSQQAVSVQDVIGMSQAKLSDAVIVTQIKTRGVAARLQSHDLILLSNAGVSEAVITAMQTAPLATVAAAPSTATRNVIVREHYYAPPVYAAPVYAAPVYVAPVYPAPWHHGPFWPHPGPRRPPGPSVHWGLSIRH